MSYVSTLQSSHRDSILAFTHTHTSEYICSFLREKERDEESETSLSLSLSLCLFSRTHRTKQRDMHTYKSRTMSAHVRKLNTHSLSSHIHTTYSHTHRPPSYTPNTHTQPPLMHSIPWSQTSSTSAPLLPKTHTPPHQQFTLSRSSLYTDSRASQRAYNTRTHADGEYHSETGVAMCDATATAPPLSDPNPNNRQEIFLLDFE